LVEETNQYYQKYLDTADKEPEILLFLPVIIQNEHNSLHSLKNFLTVTEQFLATFYSPPPPKRHSLISLFAKQSKSYEQ